MATPTNGEQLIDYHVGLGVNHKIVKVEIHGNRYFDDATIRERMSVIPATLVRYPHGRYSRNALERDLEAIRNLYRANGFRDVEVTSRLLDDYNGATAHIALFIEIKEGPQWFVSKLVIQGVADDVRPTLIQFLHSTEGQPYSDLNIATDRDNVLDYYFNNGYPAAKFDFTSVPSPEADHVNLTFIVTPGARIYVRNVVVDGLQRTRPDVVTDRISLHAGDPLSQSEINGSQRRLYDLGIFSRVDAAIQNPDGDEPTKYVLYSLEEAGRYSMNVGVGAEIGRIGGGTTSLDSPAGVNGFSPRFSFGISRLNFFGLGHTMSLQTLVSTLEQRALLTYVAPQYLGNPNLSLQFSALFDHSHDVRTFSSEREEGSIQLAQKLSKADTLQYRFTYRKVNVLGTPLVSADLIPLLSQPVRVGFLSMSFIRDTRDDPIDSHRGTYTSIDLALSAAAFGSQTDFGRVVARNSSYYQLTKDLVLARTTQFGLIERYAGLPISRWRNDSSAAAPSPIARSRISRRARAIPAPVSPSVATRYSPIPSSCVSRSLATTWAACCSMIWATSIPRSTRSACDSASRICKTSTMLSKASDSGCAIARPWVRFEWISRSAQTPRASSAARVPSISCTNAEFQARQCLKPCSGLMSSNFISRWDRHSSENSEVRIQNSEWILSLAQAF